MLGIVYEDLCVVSVLGHKRTGTCRLRSLAKMVNNRGPRTNPWKTPVVLARALETTYVTGRGGKAIGLCMTRSIA